MMNRRYVSVPAMCFEAICPIPNLTVAESIALILNEGWAKSKSLKTEELLAKVGLHMANYAHRLPSELSGGGQQQLALFELSGSQKF